MSPIIFTIIFAVLAFVLRIIPHAPNFAAVGALALFGGFYLPMKKYTVVIPLAVMFLSDLLLGFYAPGIMAAVYGSFALIGLIGFFFRKIKSVGSVAFSSLAGSILFFLVTNAAVWLFGGLYPHTILGLFESYTMGIPFFRNTLISDLFFSGLFFASYEIYLALIKSSSNFMRSFVTSPGLPLPIFSPSTEMTGTTPLLVAVKKTSSAE